MSGGCPDPGAGWNNNGGSIGGGGLCVQGQEWWFNDAGVNTLKGVDDDQDNPPRLSADMIYYLLWTIQEARDSFNRLYPTMLAEERARLDEITQGVVTFLTLDPKAVDDEFQAIQNTPGVRTTGVKGGSGGIGGGGSGSAGARPPPRGGIR